MSMAKIFRSSPRRLPADLATGDADLDARLQELDTRLAGSAAVRRPTLQEARDFLLEARAHALNAGRDPVEAAEEAVAGLGDVGEIAAEQRSRLRSVFFEYALTSGLVYGALMTAFSGLHGEYDGAWNDAALWLRIVGEFMFRAVFFGILLAGTATFLLNPRANPRPGSARADAFEVGQDKRYTWVAWLMAMFAAAMCALSVAALAGRGPFASVTPFAAGLFMLFISAHLCAGMVFNAMFRASVTREAVTVRGLFGRQRIARNAVTEVRDAGIVERLASIYAAPSLIVSWRDDGGAVCTSRIPSTPEVANIDRLRAWLDDAIDSGHTR
jgi:hypothetical protein